jgi:hypothetical protein
MTHIVDTNVALKANGPDPSVSSEPSKHELDCWDASERFLDSIRESGRIAMDESGYIWEEYKRHMRWGGQLGAGHLFLRWVNDHQWNPAHCNQIAMAPFPGDPALKGFDPSDQKFVQVALAHPERPPILVSADRVWPRFAAPLAAHGIRIEFLCPEHA